MNKSSRLRLLVVMVIIFVVLFGACMLLLVKQADNYFLNSAEILSGRIENLIQRNDEEKAELQASLKEEYISHARAAAYILENNSSLQENYYSLCRMADLLELDEINVFDKDGRIAYSTVKDYVGFSIYSGGQIAFFEPMMTDRTLALCQDLTPNTKDGKLIMYAAVWRDDGDSIVQVGISPEQLTAALGDREISKVLKDMPLTNAAYFIYDTVQDKIVSTTIAEIYGLSNADVAYDLTAATGHFLRTEINGIRQAYALYDFDQYKIGIAKSYADLYRDANWNSVILCVFLLVGLCSVYLLINKITKWEKQKEQKYIDELQESAEQLSAYKRAVLSDALISLEADLTTNQLYYGVWKDDNGNEIPLGKILGIELPCSYDTYIKLWNQRFVKSSDDSGFSGNTDRENLLQMFRSGITEKTFDYEAKTVSGRRTWLRRIISMTKNSSGHVIAYTSVKDIAALVEKNKREESYIRALATEYDSIAVVDFGEKKAQDKVTIRSRLSEKMADILDDETRNEANYSRKLELLMRKIHPEDQEKYWKNTRRERILESFSLNKPQVIDFRLMTPEGAEIYYQMRFVPIRNDDNVPVGMIASLRNIDSEIRKEIGVRKEMEKAKIAAEAANQAKSTFLFNMSHDIRTPMNAILGFTDIAEKHIDEKERVLEALAKVKMSGNHLLSLINDVLDMSRVESGTVKIEEEPVCIDMAKDNLFNILNGSAEAKNITFTSDISPSVTHRWFSADRLRMMRVLTNIISNSVKYTNPGGKIKLLAEELPCDKEGFARYRYTVSDTGIGMSEEFLAHVFEPFSRAESATKSGVVGTGLGMAITKSLVELMGGTISIESELGVGTTVRMEFENRIAEPVFPENNAAKEAEYNLEGKKILLVEDNELNREIATEILEEEGMTVDTAEDGDIAVEKMRTAAEGQYDLILMDIQMPRMNGYDATRAIRNLPSPYASGIPIIAMTANAFAEDKKNAFDVGMNGHIAKPVDVAKLLETLANIIN